SLALGYDSPLFDSRSIFPSNLGRNESPWIEYWQLNRDAQSQRFRVVALPRHAGISNSGQLARQERSFGIYACSSLVQIRPHSRREEAAFLGSGISAPISNAPTMEKRD